MTQTQLPGAATVCNCGPVGTASPTCPVHACTCLPDAGDWMLCPVHGVFKTAIAATPEPVQATELELPTTSWWLYYQCLNGMCGTVLDVRIEKFDPADPLTMLCPACAVQMDYEGYRSADEYGYGSRADTQARFIESEFDQARSVRERLTAQLVEAAKEQARAEDALNAVVDKYSGNEMAAWFGKIAATQDLARKLSALDARELLALRPSK